MISTGLRLEFPRLSDGAFTATVLDAAAANAPVDLTDCQLVLMVKTALDEPNAAAKLTLEIDSGITIENAEAGEIRVDFTAAQLDLPPKQYLWDLRLVDGDGHVKSLVKPSPFTVRAVVNTDVPA